MPVVEPRPDRDYTLLVKTPDPAVDYKLTIIGVSTTDRPLSPKR